VASKPSVMPTINAVDGKPDPICKNCEKLGEECLNSTECCNGETCNLSTHVCEVEAVCTDKAVGESCARGDTCCGGFCNVLMSKPICAVCKTTESCYGGLSGECCDGLICDSTISNKCVSVK